MVDMALDAVAWQLISVRIKSDCNYREYGVEVAAYRYLVVDNRRI